MEGGRLLVEVLSSSPGSNCMTPMALTQPVAAVAVAAAGVQAVEFMEREGRRDC